MSLDADLIVDRRRMRRKLTFWRALAVIVVILAIAAIATAWSERAGFAGARMAFDHTCGCWAGRRSARGV